LAAVWHDDIYDICGFNGPGLLVHTSRAWRRGRELSLKIETTGVAQLLAALATLLVAAHALGALFARFRQPRVIGEIAAGLVLGPTLLGHVVPGAESWLFPAAGVTPTVLGAVYQLGLLLLLFCSGAQISATHKRGENKTVGWIFTTGTVLPFFAGLGLLHVLDMRSSWGPHANAASFLLIFAIAMAVTSIPVISKIMHDLGILDTPFARVVLGVAVAEDIVLYVMSLGLAQTGTRRVANAPSTNSTAPSERASGAAHTVRSSGASPATVGTVTKSRLDSASTASAHASSNSFR
jgi:predicted Kef-type K+ transport protein